MSGTSMPISRERVAQLLGFGAVDLNTYDAVLAQDALLEGLWAVAMTAADLARISEDLMFLSSTEIAVVAVPDRFSGTSSIAAHKRNPYAPQVIKGGGAAAVGALVGGFMVEKGPTGMAMQDRAYTLKALWSGLDDLERHLRWTRQIIDGLEIDTDAARRLVESHWATTTDVAALLVEAHDLPWRTAHQIVGTFVRELRARGAGPADARPEDLADAATEVTGSPISVSADDLRDALSARAFVRRRAFPGGPGPDAVEAHVRSLAEVLERDRARADSERRRLTVADDALAAAVQACIEIGGSPDGA
jgi:argininosuccinate lyase